jgi:hypothetical protein
MGSSFQLRWRLKMLPFGFECTSNLPLACMGIEIGFKIGASVGEEEDVDVPDGEVG